MKNIHVLPTDKPIKNVGDLVKDLYGDIHIFTKKNDGKEYVKTITKLNIYITSNEEIKEGDYRFSLTQNNFELVSEFSLKVNKEYWKLNNHIYKKIILTTDQDLIKDGVQAIDDEFLEWFVKNPSCEFIEIVDDWNSPRIDAYEYRVIIPKEELKQDWFCPKCDSYVSAESVTFEETHQNCNTGVVIKEPKQETAVEYLIKRLENLNLIKDGDLENELFRQIELEAKEMEKQQRVDARQDGHNSTYNSCESGCGAKEILDGSNEQYYNETFKGK